MMIEHMRTVKYLFNPALLRTRKNATDMFLISGKGFYIDPSLCLVKRIR